MCYVTKRVKGKRNIASVPLPNPFYIAVSQLFNLADEECGAEVVKWRKKCLSPSPPAAPLNLSPSFAVFAVERKTATQVKPGRNKSVRADL